MPNLDNFTRAYVEAALWSSTDDDDSPLDSKYNIADIAPSALEAMVQDCQQFQQQNSQAIEENGDIQAGHDFWLTRNGHGAGFWDGDWPINGKSLTLASKKFGQADLYVGDDGYIYQMGKETPGPVPPREDYNPTEDELNDLKAMGIQGSKNASITASALMKELGVQTTIQSGLLRKKEPKMAFGFERNQKQYDYEASGQDVVLISPTNTTKLLVNDEAKNFWIGLDHIESETLEGRPEAEYATKVQALIQSYFDRDRKAASKYLLQVDSAKLSKKASTSYIAGVVVASDGSLEKLKFTSKRERAEKFSREAGDKLKVQLVDFKVTGTLVKE